jgi:hypothetical protein
VLVALEVLELVAMAQIQYLVLSLLLVVAVVRLEAVLLVLLQ